MRIKPKKPGLRFHLWRLFHPRQYARHKAILQNIDEMHKYGRGWSDELFSISTSSGWNRLDCKQTGGRIAVADGDGLTSQDGHDPDSH